MLVYRSRGSVSDARYILGMGNLLINLTFQRVAIFVTFCMFVLYKMNTVSLYDTAPWDVSRWCRLVVGTDVADVPRDFWLIIFCNQAVFLLCHIINTLNHDMQSGASQSKIQIWLFPTDCPSGTHRDNINDCVSCPIGTYMDRPNREGNCIECPQMTTTKEEGSVSKEECASEYAHKDGRESSFSQLFRAIGGTTGFGTWEDNDASFVLTGFSR